MLFDFQSRVEHLVVIGTKRNEEELHQKTAVVDPCPTAQKPLPAVLKRFVGLRPAGIAHRNKGNGYQKRSDYPPPTECHTLHNVAADGGDRRQTDDRRHVGQRMGTTFQPE